MLYGVILILVVVIAILIVKFQKFKYESTTQKNKEIAEARADALKKSRSTIKGQMSEQLVPFFKGFPYNASDLKFFGNGFDYICVSNMAQARDSDEIINEIVFIDIKTGSASLSPVQRKIRDAIVDGRVAWETITVKEDNSVDIKRAKKKKSSLITQEKTLEPTVREQEFSDRLDDLENP